MKAALKAGFVLAALALLPACANPRHDAPANGAAAGNPANTAANTAPPAPAAPLRIQPRFHVGQRFRTTRTLRVAEATAVGDVVTTSREVTLSEVLSVDETGRLLAVRRNYEASQTALSRDGRTPEEANGRLHGCTLELRRRAGSVEAKVLAGDASLAGENFALDGFEYALLPAEPVPVGRAWALNDAQLAGISRLVQAIGFVIEKNSLSCVLAEADASRARISLDWRLSGELNRAAAVLEFTGELVFDRTTQMVTQVKLTGGRPGAQQVEIAVSRRNADGWLDLGG